jgi:hypothetical protein
MISVGASSVNLTFMVEESRAIEVIKRLHYVCFEGDGAERSVKVDVIEKAIA